MAESQVADRWVAFKMKTDEEIYLEKFKSFRNNLVGQKIEKLSYCMTGGSNTPEDYKFGSIQSSDHGFEFILKSGDCFHIRVAQIVWTFGLEFGEQSIMTKMNVSPDGPKLYDWTNDEFIIPYLDKEVLNVKSKTWTERRKDNENTTLIDQIEIEFLNDSLFILTGEYEPEKDGIYMQADEAMIIFGKKTAEKYGIKIKNATQQRI